MLPIQRLASPETTVTEQPMEKMKCCAGKRTDERAHNPCGRGDGSSGGGAKHKFKLRGIWERDRERECFSLCACEREVGDFSGPDDFDVFKVPPPPPNTSVQPSSEQRQ